MEAMVTIPVSTYNELIDKALRGGASIDLKKALNMIIELYRQEINVREISEQPYCQERICYPPVSVENACEYLIELIDKSNDDIPQAVKEWTNNISSKKSNP